MKVLQINSVCGYGSTGKICTDIYDLLVEQGHECCIAYGRYSAPKNYRTIKIGNKFDNYIHVILTRLFDNHAFASKRVTKEFIKRIEEYNPDIIHLHNIHGYYLNIEILFDYLKRSNKKVVWTLHDCWAFTGHCSYFAHQNCDKWKNGCNHCPQKRQYPSSLLLDNSKNNYNNKKRTFSSIENMIIITPSKWLADLCKESFLSKFPVKVINNGIDTSVFKVTESNFKEKYGIKSDKFILGLASVFDERKGLKTFYKLREDINSNIGIVLIGLSEKQIKSLPEGIKGITRLSDRNELVQAYNAADLFVNPTLEDNYPTTNLESISCHTPVVTNNIGGCSETIDLDTGVVVNNYDEMLKNIKLILNDQVDFNFDRVENKVNKYVLFKKYLKLYEEINAKA